jgi:hypothetical protein
MSEAYGQVHAEDMKEDDKDDIDMRYDGCPTTEGDGDGKRNGCFLQDGSTTSRVLYGGKVTFTTYRREKVLMGGT